MKDPAQWPAATAEFWPVAKIKPYAKNARTHSFEDIKAARAAIDRYGWTYPLLVDELGELLAGHRRFAASQLEPPMEAVPVLVAHGWSDQDKKAYRLWDNQSTLTGGWDEGLLRGELGELLATDFDLSLTGFTLENLTELQMPGYTQDERIERAEETPAVPAVPVVSAGELWILGKHRLIIGDSTDAPTVARLLDGAKPHLMVTDPPYGVNYDPNWRNEAGVGWSPSLATGTVSNDDRADWTPAWQLFPGDVAYVWHGGLHATVVSQSLLTAGFQLRAQIIWNKQAIVFGRGDYHWRHEPCWYAVRKGAKGHYVGGRKQSTVWDIQNASALGGQKDDATTGHGTQKPIECMRRPIMNNSKKGDSVYEPFAGSGTTLIAAEMEGRRCFAVELNLGYAEVILRRWAGLTGQMPVREDGTPLSALVGPGTAAVPAKAPDKPQKPAKKAKVPKKRKKP